MENLSQSKKRKEATCEDEVKKKKLRKTGNDTMEYLKEKICKRRQLESRS